MYKSRTQVTMENSRASLTPQERFNNKQLFSNKIHAQVLKVTLEILKSFDKLKLVTEDKNLFLNSVNHYYSDLSAVIFHLRQVVIQIDDHGEQSVSDLKEVITELNKILLVVQESLNLETEKLIIQVKDTVIDVGPQVEKHMKIMEYDDLHEHKQKVLDVQHDLMISVEALKLYCQCSYLTFSELEGLLHEEIEKIKNKLTQIKSNHEHLTEEFSHYTRHSVQKIQDLMSYFRKQTSTENFPRDVANALKNADGNAAAYMTDTLETVVGNNPMSKLLDIIESYHTTVAKSSVEFQKALQAAVMKNIGKKDNQKLKQLFIHIFIYGLNALSCLTQSIEDAIMKK